MRMMRAWRLISLGVLIAVSFFGFGVGAEVYHWEENGVLYYSTEPESDKAERVSMWDDESNEPIKIPLDPTYLDIIVAACNYYTVDPALIKAMIKVESNYNQHAVSKAGAQGLMQLMPGTAKRFKVKDPFNPIENIWAGVYYVKYLMVLFNRDYDKVLAGYNAGENAVIKYGGIPPYRETKNYVKKCREYWELYKKQAPTFTGQADKKVNAAK